MTNQKFWRILLAIVVVALGVRVTYVAVAKKGPCIIRNTNGEPIGTSPSKCATGDELFYNSEANSVARGHGFNDPYFGLKHPGAKSPPAADHPPLTVMVLAPVSWLVDHPPLSWFIHEQVNDHLREHRYTMVVLGTILILLIGLLGRRVGGPYVGLIGAGIAALLPTLWVNDGVVMSETVTGLTVVGAMLCAFALRDRPGWKPATALGALCGLAALARAELILFIPLLAVAVALGVKRGWSERARLAVIATIAALAVITPWVAFNNARFKERTFISTNDGLALVGSNCDPVYYGNAIGLTNLEQCLAPVPVGDQSQVAKVWRQRAIDYMKDHKSRLGLVILARIGRTWSLFRPGDMVTFNINEDREPWVTRLGIVVFYPVMLLALAGAVVLWWRRQRGSLWILAVPAITVTVGVAVSYGQTRFRAAAEPSVAILAGVALAALTGAWRAPRPEEDQPAPEPQPAGPPETAAV